MVNTNCKDQSTRLTVAPWAYRSAYKTNLSMSPCRLVYENAFHLPFELEHKVHWVIRELNFDRTQGGNLRKL